MNANAIRRSRPRPLHLAACTCGRRQPCATCTAWRRLAFALWARRAAL